MSETLRLHLLGDFALRTADGAVLLGAGKGLAVLAYLATSRDRQSSRQALTDLLWPDQNRERARSSLRQALFGIRRSLGQDIVSGEGEWLALAPTLATDVDDFQAALQRGAMDAAVAAYGGPLIPDDGGIRSRHFEQWVAAERLRLQSAFIAAAHAHHRDLTDRGDVATAIEVATRLRDADVESDDAWHPLFLSLALANRYAALELEASALRAARLAHESDLDAATEALLQRLRRQRRRHAEDEHPDSQPEVPVHPEFQGRTGLLRDIAAAWQQVQRGRAITLVLEAPSGYGKTRVLQEVGRRLRLERVRVIHGVASYREQDEAYAIIAELVGQLARLPGAAGIARSSAVVLARLVPALADTFQVPLESAVEDPSERLRLRSNAFADLCGAVADESPVVLMVDDLQWADSASCQCLARALEKLAAKPVLLLGASRAGNPLAGPTVPLLPLTPEDVLALLSSIATIEPPAWTPAQTEHLTQVCSGSPFRILQGLRSAIAGGALSVAGDRWTIVDWDRGMALVNPAVSMHQRFSALSALEQRIIAMLGTLTRPVTVDELGAALTVEPADVLEGLRRLDHQGFASRSTADAWTLAHALVAEDASTVLPGDLRQEAAARLGQVLARDVGTAQQLRDAVHLLLTGGELFSALDVVERFLRQTRYDFDAETVTQLVAGARGDAVFTRHVQGLLARGRRRRTVGTMLRVAVALIAIGGAGFGLLRWRVATASGPAAIAASVLGPAQPPTPPELVPLGLHAYFPFDGSAENRMDASASGGPVSVRWVRDRHGVPGRAAYFDRAAYIDLPPTVLNDLPSGTLTLWVSWDGSGGLQALTSKQRNNDNSWGILSLNGFAGQGGQPTPGDSGRLYYHGSHEHMTGATRVLESRTRLTPRRWYHVAVTWDEDVMRLYVDGRAEATVDCVRCDIAPNVAADVISRVGDWVPDGRRFRFGGTLDELRVYARVLTTAEIRTVARE